MSRDLERRPRNPAAEAGDASPAGSDPAGPDPAGPDPGGPDLGGFGSGGSGSGGSGFETASGGGHPGATLPGALLLALAAAAPALPQPFGLLLLALCLTVWAALRPPVWDLAVVGVGGLAALLLLGAGWRTAGGPDLGDPHWRATTQRSYAAAWEALDAEADRVAQALQAADLARDVRSDEQRLAAVRLLSDLVDTGSGSHRPGRRALMLVDPDGQPVAWAGEGLLHELVPQEIPAAGRTFQASFGAVTLLAVEPLDDGRRPWRAVAARSHSTERLPFVRTLPLVPRGADPGSGLRWSLVWEPGQAVPGATVLGPGPAPSPLARNEPPTAGGNAASDGAASGTDASDRFAPGAGEAESSDVERGGTPLLVVERGPVAGEGDAPRGFRAWAWGLLALSLLLLAATRATGLALAASAGPARLGDPPAPGGTGGGEGLPALPPRPALASPVAGVTVVAVGGALALARALGAQTDALLALALGIGLAVAGVGLAPRWSRPSSRRTAARAVLGGAAAVLVLALVAWGLQLESAAFDPAARRGSPVTLFTLRLAVAAAAVGLLALAGGRPSARGAATAAEHASGAPGRGEVWGWLALPLLLVGAAAVDLPGLALPLLAGVGALLALWLRQRRRSLAILAVLVVLASALASGVWEAAHRQLLREHLAQRVLPRLEVPGDAQRTALVAEVERFFEGADLTRFVPRTPQGLEREDLAFLLWQVSPLARPDALSRLVVQPLDAGGSSDFSFGFPVAEPPAVEVGAGRAPFSAPEREWWVEGTAFLQHGGEPWAQVRWSLLPLPGFRLAAGADLENVEAALLRGLPGGVAESGLPGSALFVAYGPQGRAEASPWREQTRLAPVLAGEGPATARVATPAGPAWATARPAQGGGWHVLYLPWLTPRAAVERVGSLTLEVFLAVLAAALVALLVALPRAAFRAHLRRAVRSYSRRLLLVYTVLLLVPLLLLNVVLVAAVENRLRKEQRATGEAALASAQKVVGDYLASVEPGFDLANVLDDQLLLWISEVLRHEINLYWGSEVWASSKPELFTARLLPKRIPGESFAGIAFLGYDLSARTNRVGDVSYLELYAPLRVGGEQVEPVNFFLSMPLLAQQEEVARELAALRRQALLVTAVLILLVSAVGVRLSRSFTRPLTELVEGTRRIAAGATSLDLAPTELELAALVEAVDEMARRIAVGREHLVREKQVVERMVEHITSGVVSLDRERRVLMRNRVAAELLGVEVGDRLDEALARRERLAELVPWLAAADRHLAQRTVRLLSADEGETGEGAQAVEDDGGEGTAEREWTLVWVPVPGPGEPAALLVVEDVTETLRSQRLEAWAEMARIIAHEIKNPLTPIRLNIEHLQQVWSDQRDREVPDERFGQVLERCAENVLRQVEELREIASEFSTYSRIPKIEPRRGDLVEAMGELVEPYRSAPPPGVEVLLETAQETLPARFDRRLLARAVRNLVENALRASSGGGRVVVRVERRPVPPPRPGAGATEETAGPGREGRRLSGAEARISVLDAGPGIAPQLLQRIFDPYFSTFDTGTGLGLPIARRIAEEHGGSIAARNRPGGGLEVAITLPVD